MSPYYIGSVQAVLLADAITNPIVRLMDGGGNFKRHVLVHMSGTDERAKAFEEGTDWLLAERYTDLAKTVLSKFVSGNRMPSPGPLLLVRTYVISVPFTTLLR